MLATPAAPVVSAKFRKIEILGEMGRLLFFLLDAFSVSGYHIRLADNLPPAALDKYGRRASAGSSRANSESLSS